MSLRTKRLERGAAAVEMALVLPVLLLFIGGIVDFGRAYFTQVVLANAAREGARAAVVGADPIVRANAATTGIPALDKQAPVVAPSTACSGASPTQVTVTTSASFRYFFLGFIPGITN